jgi:hypothetical protein
MKKIFTTFVLTIVLLLGVRTTCLAQTTLSAGDIVIVEFNGNGTDGFTFMPLVDLSVGTVIHFTDYGWNGTAIWTAEEGTTIPPGGQGNMITYTAPSAITAGTLIRQNTANVGGSAFTEDLDFSSYNWNHYSYIGALNSLGSGHDGILVFQGPSSSPTFIWAYHTGQWGKGSYADYYWSNLPTGLTNGTSAVYFPDNSTWTDVTVDDGYYSGPNTAATAAVWRSRVANSANWTTSATGTAPTLLYPGNYTVNPTIPAPSGTGTSGDPYLISNLSELYWIAEQVNAVTDYSTVFSGKYFKQTADIDASSTSTWFGGLGWTPIGYSNTSYGSDFGGIYDGQEHTISGLYINRLHTYEIGLFGIINTGTVKNLGLTNVSITSGGASDGDYCGALSGYLYSGAVIDNCYSTGSVTGYNEVGGLVGEDDGSAGANSITNSHSSCAVTVANSQGGGLIGKSSSSTISNCFATGAVTASGSTVTYMAGLIGSNYSTVSRCYATGASTGMNQVAGLIGANSGNIDNCYATGSSTATNANNGGLLGDNEGIVNNSYATGLTTGASATGGFVGSNASGGTINNNCFWNSTILSTGCGSNSGTFSALGKTTAEMQTTSTFTGAGWDFSGETTNGTDDYWGRSDDKNNKYPYLSWQYPTVAPTVTTQAISSIASTTATGNGNITSLGSSNPTAYGVCWNTTGTPTTSDSKADKGAASATGAFTASMTSLSANTTYHVRAYATNIAGTSYGTEVSFTTSGIAPTVTTQAVSSIASTTATGNGNITALGVPNPKAYGVCWNTTGTPTTSDSKADKGAASATGSFTASMTSLSANTTYHVRAYVTNTAGTSYGTEVSFTTSGIAPTVTTQAVSSIAVTTATGNGNITALGVPNPTAYGVCWNTTGTPTTSDSKVDKGAASVTGAFTASMTSLNANTTYYVRTFATNTAGTSYGSQVSFTTNAISLPTVAFSTTSSSGAESVSSASLQVELSAASASNVTVDYAITGTATGGGTDYTLANGTLTITAGTTTNTITIASIVDDALVEGNETVIVTLSNPANATLGTNTAHTYTITDNDVAQLPTIAFSSTISSGAESVSSASLQVELSAASASDVTVDYAVTGTATGGGTDYTLANGTLTITVGNTTNTITIASIVDDALVESDETVIVTLSNPANATLGTNRVHTYTITNNDATNVSDISKSNVSVHPNPFADMIYFDNLSSDISQIIITDMTGQIVYNTEYKGEKSVSLDHLSSGVYLLTIINNVHKKQVFKIVKE